MSEQPVTVRSFVEGAYQRIPTAAEVAERLGAAHSHDYAEGLVNGAREALLYVLEFIDQAPPTSPEEAP